MLKNAILVCVMAVSCGGEVCALAPQDSIALRELHRSTAEMPVYGDRYGFSLVALAPSTGNDNYTVAIGAIQEYGFLEDNCIHEGRVVIATTQGLNNRITYSNFVPEPTRLLRMGINVGYALCGMGESGAEGAQGLAAGAPAHDNAASAGGVFADTNLGAAGGEWNAVGAWRGDGFGHSLASMPDINGDRVPDLLVGAPRDSRKLVVGWPATRDDDATVALDEVADAGYVCGLSGVDGRVLFVASGQQSGEAFGYSVAVIGDVTGDGVAELAIGAPLWGSDQGKHIGRVAILDGDSNREVLSVNGIHAGDLFGSVVISVDDVDGDGIEEIAIAAPQLAWPREPKGYVRLFSIASSRSLLTIEELAAESQLGRAMCSTQDMDGDGIRDLAIGAPSASREYELEGMVGVYSSVSGKLIAQEWGGAPGVLLGSSVAFSNGMRGGLGPVLAVGAPGTIDVEYGHVRFYEVRVDE